MRATIRATWTLTLAMAKAGLLLPHAADHVGDLWGADIGVPPQAFEKIGLVAPSWMFEAADLVRLSPA